MDDARLVIGTEQAYPPYSFRNAEGEPAGYNVDLTRALADAMDVGVEVRVADWQRLRSDLAAGRIDAIAGMFYSEARDADVDFSPPFTVVHHAVLTRTGGPAIESEHDLRDKAVIVAAGDIMHEHAVSNLLTARLIPVSTQREALEMLASGKHDCALLARLPALYWQKERDHSGLETKDFLLRPSQYCFAVREGNTAVQHLLNEGLALVGENGTHKVVRDKWLSPLESADSSLDAALQSAALVIGILIFFVLMFAIWVNTLKRQVDVRTEALKRNEQRLDHQNRVLAALRNVNQLITHETDPDRLLKRVCEDLVATRGYYHTWIARCDPAGKPAGWAEAELGARFYPVARRLEQGEWPPCVQHAWHQPSPVMIPSRSATCADCPLSTRDDHQAAAVISLDHSDRQYGILTLALPPEFLDDREEQRLIEEVAGDVAAALHGIRIEGERRQAEQARYASERSYGNLFRHAPFGIILADDDLNIVDANPAALTTLGYEHDGLVGLRAVDIIHPEDLALRPVEHTVAEADDHGLVRTERRYIKQNGDPLPVELTLCPLRGSGSQASYMVMFSDIAKRKELEDELRQAQKLESIGRLAGGVAHDFNNLLMGVMGYVELCREHIDPQSPVREWLDEITSDAQRSVDLTRQLLAFARRQKITPKVLDLNETITGMLKLLRHLIGENIELVWIPGSDLWPVELDPSQLDQMLANLCVNARDAIDGVGRVTIETKNRSLGDEDARNNTKLPAPGDYVCLTVSDDGCGMDPDTLEHIFEPFFTTKEGERGTGLGLPTVYGIVKQHHGHVTVDTVPDRGTTFCIHLPKAVSKSTADEHQTAKVSPDLPGGSETILLVEDEKSVRKTARLFLTKLGYSVLAAEHPEKALDIVADHGEQIDMLITDIVMPGMSGKDLADKLVQEDPDLHCLFMSGYTDDVIAEHGVLNGDLNFIAKPFSRDELAHHVRRVLDAQMQRQ